MNPERTGGGSAQTRTRSYLRTRRGLEADFHPPVASICHRPLASSDHVSCLISSYFDGVVTGGGREQRAGSPCTKCDGWDAACHRGAQPERRRRPEDSALRNVSGQSELFQKSGFKGETGIIVPGAGTATVFPVYPR